MFELCLQYEPHERIGEMIEIQESPKQEQTNNNVWFLSKNKWL